MNGKMIDMEQILLFLVECVVLYVAIRVILFIIGFVQYARSTNASRQADIEINKDIEIKVEVHNNVVYFYNKDTQEFIAQGASADELIDHIKDRKFTDVKFLIDNAELAKANWLNDIFKVHRVEV